MPLQAERNLKQGARKHGFKPGTDRYNRYVYGTLNIIEHNKAGGPEQVFEHNPLPHGKKLSEPSMANGTVHPHHIVGIIVVGFIIYYFLLRRFGFSFKSAKDVQQAQGYESWLDLQHDGFSYNGDVRGIWWGTRNTPD